MPQHSVTIPAKDCCFLASVEVGTNGDNAKTAPVRLFARSTNPVKLNDEVGYVVHDFSGMKSKARVAIDYCHDADEVIGYANHFDLAEDYGLVASGALVPYSANPEDKATEIIFKAQNGVPYEASITMGSDAVAQKIGPGAKTTVNGIELTGPLTVFREWTLRGIAICPHGKDSKTAALALSDVAPLVSITFSDEEAAMPADEPKPAEAEAQAVEAVAVNDTQPAEIPAPVAEVVEASEPVTEPAKVDEEAAQPVTAPVEATALSEGKRFLQAFGAQGGVWFAEGKTFAEAQELHFASIVSERDTLKQKVTELSAQLAETRGEKEPISFSVDNAPAVKPEPKQFAHLGDGLGKFADSIKFKK